VGGRGSVTPWKRQPVRCATMRVAEVTKMDMKLENGKVAAFRTARLALLQIRGLILVPNSQRG